MNKSIKTALVVEGGAMRGIFASGVLDAFLENQHNPFHFTVGVSAGSTNLIGYLSGNHGRSKQILFQHARSNDFINFRRYLRGGHFCDVNWLWEMSFKQVPLNFDRYLEQETPLFVVTTNVNTGKACYFEVTADNMHQLFPASCAIPFMYRDFPRVDDEPMTDGGLADAIPVIWAYEQGARDITVILSQPLGFKKPQIRFPALIKPFFKNNPSLFNTALNRATRYNQALDFIRTPPSDCRVQVISPPNNFEVKRLTLNTKLLDVGYEQGRNAGLQHINQKTDLSIFKKAHSLAS
ncbi:MAG: patatin family protein [Pseudomonadota bacterium]